MLIHFITYHRDRRADMVHSTKSIPVLAACILVDFINNLPETFFVWTDIHRGPKSPIKKIVYGTFFDGRSSHEIVDFLQTPQILWDIEIYNMYYKIGFMVRTDALDGRFCMIYGIFLFKNLPLIFYECAHILSPMKVNILWQAYNIP